MSTPRWSFEVVAGDRNSPVVLHVPHSSTRIPDDVRRGIVLGDEALAGELLRMTDAHTDRIALAAAATATPRPWVFVNKLSRLVVDPERFTDDREEMHAVGMGAVYTRTSGGEVLRHPTAEEERHLIETHFDPYAAGMTELVRDRLEACGRALIIDLHSYPTTALPYELHAADRRPVLCIGSDDVHTPAVLIEMARAAFKHVGDAVVNEPFRGVYVPTAWFGTDPRVTAIMLEIRRDTYLDELTGQVGPGLDGVLAAVAETARRAS